MDRIPHHSTNSTQDSLSRELYESCHHICSLRMRGRASDNEITNDVQWSLTSVSKDCSSDKDEPNFSCVNCHQLRTVENLNSEDTVKDYFSGNVKESSCGHISDYLEKDKPNEYFEEFLLSEKVLGKFALLLDIVTIHSERSCCFTKAYGHYAEGTGSVLKMIDIDDTEIFNKYRDLSDEKQKFELLSVLKLRYFTPREVANLHGFPTEFCFPPSISVKQQYRLLGNSLNVHVVSELMNCLFQSP